MRSFLIVLLSLFLPLQLSLAVAGQYCSHEIQTTGHIGHHTHEHTSSAQKKDPVKSGSTAANDLDCHTCHTGCSLSTHAQAHGLMAESSAVVVSVEPHKPESLPLDRPERPNWVTPV